MTGFSIRTAHPSERPALIELQRRAALANPGDRAVLEAHPELIDTPVALFHAGNVLVAERFGTQLGFAALLLHEDGKVELDGLFVEPAHWKAGIGRALVTSAMARTLALGATRLNVIGNPHAEDFYFKLDFVLTGRFKTRFGTGLVFERRIAPGDL